MTQAMRHTGKAIISVLISFVAYSLLENSFLTVVLIISYLTEFGLHCVSIIY